MPAKLPSLTFRGRSFALLFCELRVFAFFVSFAITPISWAQNGEITEEKTDSTFRARTSILIYRYSLGEKSIYGTGPQVDFEKAIGHKWCVGGGIGQAFSYSQNLQTLFMSFEVNAWYSLIGKFTRNTSVWNESGGMIAQFSESNTSGLRLGLGTQQYFFNTETSAVPLSGFSAKLLYEFGLKSSVDVGLGADYSTLMNPTYKLSSLRSVFSLIIPF